MTRRMTILLFLTLTALFIAGCGLLQEPEEASGPIEAIPLEVETQAPEVGGDAATATAPPIVEEPAPETDEAYPEPAQIAAQPQTAYPDAAADVDAAADEAAAGELRIYQISQEESQVTFELDEDLRGERLTVVGGTNQVAAELALNLADLSTAQVGVVQINARTLLTDNNFRNRAIQNEILETGTYEFITFRPTGISGLPASAAVGEEVAFTVQGDLTIRDITQPVSFQIVAVVLSETELSGRATTTIERQAFNLTIPEVPQVANVEEAVELTITFVARAT